MIALAPASRVAPVPTWAPDQETIGTGLACQDVSRKSSRRVQNVPLVKVIRCSIRVTITRETATCNRRMTIRIAWPARETRVFSRSSSVRKRFQSGLYGPKPAIRQRFTSAAQSTGRRITWLSHFRMAASRARGSGVDRSSSSTSARVILAVRGSTAIISQSQAATEWFSCCISKISRALLRSATISSLALRGATWARAT
jgi:hypothetical protein